MTEPNEKTHIHFIGICGTGMATLAAMLKIRGFPVSGSDEGVYPPMSDFLQSQQIPIMEGFTLQNMSPEPDLVIVGNALSRGNPEIEYVLNFKIPYMSLPEALKHFFLRAKKTVVVTGTHGKTTTASMIAWGLHHAEFSPSFLVGGITGNFQSSYQLGEGPHFVVEGDEYDSAFFDKGAKFLHYMPDVAVIGNIEFDHADIYPDLDAIRVQFARFVNLIPGRGFLLTGAESAAAGEVAERAFCRRETFGVEKPGDWSANNIEHSRDGPCFEALYQGKLFRRICLPLQGRFNVKNALAAIGVLHHLGVPEDDIREALGKFRGVLRRLQFRAEVAGIRIYEDFAHHPTAVRETLAAVRRSFDPARLWAIYEPRSATSRRNIFQDEIALALSEADCIALPPLYKPEKIPASERLDIDAVTASLRRAGRAAWHLDGVEGIISKVLEEARRGDMIVVLSNGGFGGIVERLPEALSEQRNAQ
jgi:UDP-N-acetylmuramate: L-alanyl-gamma-D-glutamyl-meso-diaminopimelate ligase